MVSLKDVIDFMKDNKILTEEDQINVGFVALKMASEFARSRNVQASMNDVIFALTGLCVWNPPGKPPQDDRTRKIINALCKVSKLRNTTIFVLPIAAAMIKPQQMTALSLRLKVPELQRLKLDLTGIPKQRTTVAGTPTTLVTFGNVVGKIHIPFKTS